MANISRISTVLLISTASLALAACGADDIASPGTGGNVTINNTTITPPPPPPPPVATLVTPAGGCPTIADPQQLTDSGTIAGPTGTYRVCTLPARVNVSSTLPRVAGLVYRLGGRVDIGTDQGPTEETTDPADVVLTVEPGVIAFGGTGVSWLNVNRGNRIQAVGTPARPIIWTSRDNILGLNTDSSIGQWGGLVLNGRAPITDCSAPAAAPGTIACERQVEGAIDPALYGGATPADTSGRISYMQIRYSGFVLSGNSELQALTTGGTGSATVLDHIQSHNSSDDAVEFFGGRLNLKYLVMTGADDDGLDTDVGIKANIQYVLGVQRQGTGDSMIEADSDNAADGNLPRQNTRLSNFTFIQRNNIGNLSTILLRGGTDYTLANGVISSPTSSCLAISRPQTAATAVNATIDEVGAPLVRSVVGQCGTPPFSGRNGVTDQLVADIFTSGSNGNNSSFTLTLTGLFINGANETAAPSFNATTIDPFFDNAPYVGAVRNAADDWYRTWTCNSSTADLGTGNTGLCTTIPTI